MNTRNDFDKALRINRRKLEQYRAIECVDYLCNAYDYNVAFDCMYEYEDNDDKIKRASSLCNELIISFNDAYEMTKVCSSDSAIRMIVTAAFMAKQPMSNVISVLKACKI